MRAPALAMVVTGLVLGVASTGCHAILGVRTCDEIPAARLALAPTTLAATGLYDGPRSTHVADGVYRFRPRYALYGDGATKTRWMSLPPGARIDTSDMDAWKFPKGTKLWKEIARDGKKVETRYLHKVEDGDGASAWLSVAYVWNATETEATATPEGRVDANGTSHDVPAARACAGCHGGTASYVLGFSAVQLDERGTDGDTGLARLRDEGRFTTPPPIVNVPGDADTASALGYLHVNCGHCHNQHRPAKSGARCFDPRTGFDLSLRTTDLASVKTTATYRTAIGPIVTPGSPNDSPLYRRLAGQGIEPRMPATGTETIDEAGVALVGKWITGLR